MKRITTIVLFASIFAVAVGTLGLSVNSATLMVSPVSQTQEGVSMLGHVEYKLHDEFGNIKSYLQADNVVVVAGKDCAASYLFTDASGSVFDCIAGNAAFTFIGIGNGTILNAALPAIGALNATLADSTTGDADTQADCASTDAGVGTANGGDMARRDTTADITSAGETTIVVLDTSAAGSTGPFTFDLSNATAVTDSGLFNADYPTSENGDHRCSGTGETGGTAGTDWNMFSRQLLNNDVGITVSDGDSLSVKWTITIGATP